MRREVTPVCLGPEKARAIAPVIVWLASVGVLAQSPASQHSSNAEAFLRILAGEDVTALQPYLHSTVVTPASDWLREWHRAIRAGGSLLSQKVTGQGDRDYRELKGCTWVAFAVRFEHFPARVEVYQCPDGDRLSVTGYSLVPESPEGEVRLSLAVDGNPDVADVTCRKPNASAAKVGLIRCEAAMADSTCVVRAELRGDDVSLRSDRGDCETAFRAATQHGPQGDGPTTATDAVLARDTTTPFPTWERLTDVAQDVFEPRLVFVYVLAFPLFLCGFTFFGSLFGWRSLAGAYPDRRVLGATVLRFRSGSFGAGRYGNSLRFDVSPQGLRIAVLPLLRCGHRPFFVPWSDVSVELQRRGLFDYWAFRFAALPRLPLLVRPALGEKLLAAGRAEQPRSTVS